MDATFYGSLLDYILLFSTMQGWKLLTVRLSGTVKNGGGQVKISSTFPKERQNSIEMDVVHISQTGINNGGPVNILDTFRKERVNVFVISIPVMHRKFGTVMFPISALCA